MRIKGWPPKDNNAKSNRGYDSGRVSGGLNADDKRPNAGSKSAPDNGTPASDSFRFPTRPMMPTKESDD